MLRPSNNHVFIAGITRSGKTYFAINSAAKLPGPVLFFNIQEEDTPTPFITVLADHTDEKQLIGQLRNGRKIDLRFGDASAAQIGAVMHFLIHKVMTAGFSESRPVYLIIDECHILRDGALEAAIQAATRGLKRGVRCIFITQRPALANKTLYTQSAEQYIFHCSTAEREYLKSKGIDFDFALKTWAKYGKYSYIYTDGFTTEGRQGI